MNRILNELRVRAKKTAQDSEGYLESCLQAFLKDAERYVTIKYLESVDPDQVFSLFLKWLSVVSKSGPEEGPGVIELHVHIEPFARPLHEEPQPENVVKLFG